MHDDPEDPFVPHSIEWNNAKRTRIWDYYSASPTHRTRYFGEAAGPHVVRLLKRRGVFKGARHVVDLSCGTGAIVSNILHQVASGTLVSGVDPSESSVSECNRRNAEKSGFRGAVCTYGFKTQLPAQSVDVALMTEVVEHLGDTSLDLGLQESHRILKEGGLLIITTPNDETLEREETLCPECGCMFHRWQHERSWTARTLAATLQSYGFDAKHTQTVSWGNELIDLACRLIRRKPTGLLAIARRE